MKHCSPLYFRGSTVIESRVLPFFMPVPMPKSRILALLLAFTVFMAFPLSAFASPSKRPEAEVPSWADLVVLTGAQPGLVLMVVAGIHGDEVSGPMTASQLAAGPPPARGTLVILPGASPEALAAGQRWLPGWSDLNRAFLQDGEWGTPGMAGEPGTAEATGVRRSARSAYAVSDPTYLRSEEILALIVSIRPDLLLDLHESDQYWTEGDGPALVVPASTTLTTLTTSAGSAGSAELALELLELPGLEDFSFTGPPPEGSLVAAVDGLLGIPALLVEAPDALAVDGRIAVHLAVVHAAMRMLGMGCLETGCPATCCQAAKGTVPLTGESP